MGSKRRRKSNSTKKPLRKRVIISLSGILAAAITGSLTALFTSVPAKVGAILSPNQDPVLISVRHWPGQSGGCGFWIVDKPPQDLTPMDNVGDMSALETWVHANDAADTDYTELEVTVQGLTPRPVVLTDLQFVVMHRNFGPIQGALIGNQCGGPETGRYIEVDLSKQPVRLVASKPDQMPSRNEPAWELKPVKFPYTVSATDTEVFKILADSNQCDCEWYAELFWSTGGKNGESIINDDGRPFRTAPYQRVRQTYSYDPKSRRWVRDTSTCVALVGFECDR